MSESMQTKKGRVRKPRVHIEYKVETGGAEVVKDLPFLVGVMGDFSGDPTSKLEPLRERDFTNIDRDNFDEVMSTMNAGLNLRVKNTMADDDSQIAVQLAFSKLDDFSPEAVANQIPHLKELLANRNKLRDLLVKVGGNPELEEILEKVLTNTEKLKSIAGELGVEEPKAE
jgi:type VI secretion system protein ImpB